jgi:tetratricopeptide (TPR) repeat protein
LKAYDKVLTLDPNRHGARYNRACVHALSGDKTKALADLKKAIEMQPSLKAHAAKDSDFKALLDDADFKKLTE